MVDNILEATPRKPHGRSNGIALYVTAMTDLAAWEEHACFVQGSAACSTRVCL